MKPILRQIITTPQQSFIVRKDTGEEMINSWHYHSEIEILLIRRSFGTWMIGDHIGHFKTGDVVIIGSNLPHCFRHDYDYTIQRDEMPGESVCVKFQRAIFEDSLTKIPELKGINDIISGSVCGLKLLGKTKSIVAKLIDKMVTSSPGRNLVYLLSVLQEVAERREFSALSSKGFMRPSADADQSKIKLVLEFTFNHFSEKITVDYVSGLLNMSSPSFCRYFKSKTNKTYVQFLMEVRIGYACRLLTENEKSVKEISYDCGYKNISHFNHQFKMITNKKPLAYKKDYLIDKHSLWVHSAER